MGRPSGARKKLWGSDNPRWNPNATNPNVGRDRARYRYKVLPPCQRCGAEKTERHHVDGNTFNNEPSNIRFLCRTCHMVEDGRIGKLEEFNQKKKAAAAMSVVCHWCKKVTVMRIGDYYEKLRWNKHPYVFCGRSCACKFTRSLDKAIRAL